MFTIVTDECMPEKLASVNDRPVHEYADVVRLLFGRFFADARVETDGRRQVIHWLVPGEVCERPEKETVKHELACLRERLRKAADVYQEVCTPGAAASYRPRPERLILAEVLSQTTLPAAEDAVFTTDGRLVLLRWGLRNGQPGTPWRRPAVDGFVESIAARYELRPTDLPLVTKVTERPTPRQSIGTSPADVIGIPTAPLRQRTWMDTIGTVAIILLVLSCGLLAGLKLGQMRAQKELQAANTKAPAGLAKGDSMERQERAVAPVPQAAPKTLVNLELLGEKDPGTQLFWNDTDVLVFVPDGREVVDARLVRAGGQEANPIGVSLHGLQAGAALCKKIGPGSEDRVLRMIAATWASGQSGGASVLRLSLDNKESGSVGR